MIRRHGWHTLSLLAICAMLASVITVGTRSVAAATPTELFFSEYIEGSSNNKALEIYNGTGATIDLAAGKYSVQMFFNGSPAVGLTINLSGSIASGDVFVLAQSSASAAILAQADQTSAASWYNGDDAITLRKDATVIDSIGQTGFDPGTEWGSGLSSTADNTLRRKNSVSVGDGNSGDLFDPGVEWDGFAVDSFDNLGSYGTTPPSPTPTPPSPTPTPPPATRIRDIQGSGHTSPRNGQTVSNVPGIVTAKVANGFYLQDPNPDTTIATSEAIFVFTSSAPTVNVGDALVVGGRVSEFRPGGSSSTNLTTTQIGSPTISVTSSNNPLPAVTIIGDGGRVPPTNVIDDDATGSVETSGSFDPASDGIDFYESLEGMRVQINNAVATGPTSSFGEIPVLSDNGANAGLRTPRGGIIIRPDDFNPERIMLDDVIMSTPVVNVGDRFTTPVTGVMDYSFGNFKLLITSALTPVSGGLTRESTTPAAPGELAIASFNVENLDPADGADKFNTLADLIVNNLQSPDIIAIEEAQDNNGPINNGEVDATQTFNTLIAAIQNAGGPTYEFRNINPVNNQDGGEPGGNIRVGFLFRSDRGVSFIDRPGGTSTSAVTVVNGASGPELSFSPGRIDPGNTAFNSSRKPLVGEFSFHGQKLFVIANHFNSKGGDQPLFGRFQPPTRSSEIQRKQQAQIVNDFVDAILAVDPDANIVAAGDFNDFQFSEAINILKGGVLYDMIDTLPENERYSYVFEGNAQTLDHILVSGNLFNNTNAVHDVVHVNAEFADQASDHDPQVSRFTLNTAPTVNANGPYRVDEGGSVTLGASGSDREGGALSYAWDLDNNGSFEHSGQSVSFSAAELDGPSSRTVKVRVTDIGGLSASAETTITINNVAPAVTAPADQRTSKGATSSFQLGSFADPGADAPWTIDVNWGDGSAHTIQSTDTAGAIGSASHSYASVGQYTVTITVTDQDGGVGTASFKVSSQYVFSGFFQPVDNLPTLNIVNAGRSIPIKFSLGGNQGLNIFAAGYPRSQQITCDSTAPTDGIEETVTTNSGLSYDPSIDQYTYVWKTEKSWAGTCRQFVVQLNDGTFQRANFRFNN